MKYIGHWKERPPRKEIHKLLCSLLSAVFDSLSLCSFEKSRLSENKSLPEIAKIFPLSSVYFSVCTGRKI